MSEQSAGVTVRVYPMGQGQVMFEVISEGPVHLTCDEMVYTLRSAANQLESGRPEGGSDS